MKKKTSPALLPTMKLYYIVPIAMGRHEFTAELKHFFIRLDSFIS
jgi:hypothetical protein